MMENGGIGKKYYMRGGSGAVGVGTEKLHEKEGLLAASSRIDIDDDNAYDHDHDHDQHEMYPVGSPGSSDEAMVRLDMTPSEDDEPSAATDGTVNNINSNNNTPTSSSLISNNNNNSFKYPKEPFKLLMSVISMGCAASLNDIVLAWAHERVPSTPPLPDIFFTHFPYYPSALEVSEYLIIVAVTATFALCVFHKHRWIVFRRLMVISSLLYFGRSLTMLVTQLPVADVNYYCAPKLNRTDAQSIILRGLKVVVGLGLSVNGKHTLCGDYVYSGHTLVLVLAYLMWSEYSPRRWWILHWLIWLGSMTGIIMLLLSRGHYTLDCILAYYVTTRLFWLYHTLANHSSLREESPLNLVSRVWWFRIFSWMECNVQDAVPRRFEFPIPVRLCARRLLGAAVSKHNQH